MKVSRVCRLFCNAHKIQAELKKFQDMERANQFQDIFNQEMPGKKVHTLHDLRESYHRLMQRYHSDINQNETTSKAYEKIAKIITRAYREVDKDKLIKDKDGDQKNYSEKSGFFIEDQVCMELFGKNYSDSMYSLFMKGNEKMKTQFFQKMYAKTGDSKYQQKQQQTQQQPSTQTSPPPMYKRDTPISSPEPKGFGWVLGGMGFVILTLLYKTYHSSKSPEKEKKHYAMSTPSPYIKEMKEKEKEKPKEVRKKKTDEEIIKEKLESNQLIRAIVREHPPSLHIPFGVEPPLMKQLTEYSIAPDIHLYEVDPKWYEQNLRNQVLEKGEFDMNKAKRLIRIKPNTVMTLSLEAERALQNIYVKVKDVISEIKETGKFTPPKVLFRFHGYILFELREKPITLANYRNTDYISLFDLFFQYYSPMFLKRDNFMMYLVEKDNMELFGHVYLNNRKSKQVYLKPGQKVAYFHEEIFKDNSLVLDYKLVWENYYAKNLSNWSYDKLNYPQEQ